jgi:hypothetical protein
MAKNKDLVPYSKIESVKSRIRVSGQKIKKAGKKFAGKATTEQKFLGKTLPKYIGKAAKFAITKPITTTALFFVPDVVKALGKQKGINFSDVRQFDTKGRKFL